MNTNELIEKYNSYFTKEIKNDPWGILFAELCSKIVNELTGLLNNIEDPTDYLNLCTCLYAYNYSLLKREEFYKSEEKEFPFFNFAPSSDLKKATEQFTGMKFDGNPYIMMSPENSDPSTMMKKSFKTGSLFWDVDGVSNDPHNLFLQNNKKLLKIIHTVLSIFLSKDIIPTELFPVDNDKYLFLSLFKIFKYLDSIKPVINFKNFTKKYLLYCIMNSDKKVFWEAASDFIIDNFYLKSIPKGKEFETSSFLTPEDISLVLDVDSSLKYMSDGRYAQSAGFIIKSHLNGHIPTEEDNRDLESMYQNSLNYFGKDINEYPGIILCHYSIIKKLDKKNFASTFSSKDFGTIYDLELYMKVYNENNLGSSKSQFEVINEVYLNNPDHPEKKHKLLIGFLFFTLWDISKKSLMREEYCNVENLDRLSEHSKIAIKQQSECLDMFYESTVKYCDAETLKSFSNSHYE